MKDFPHLDLVRHPEQALNDLLPLGLLLPDQSGRPCRCSACCPLCFRKGGELTGSWARLLPHVIGATLATRARGIVCSAGPVGPWCPCPLARQSRSGGWQSDQGVVPRLSTTRCSLNSSLRDRELGRRMRECQCPQEAACWQPAWAAWGPGGGRRRVGAGSLSYTASGRGSDRPLLRRAFQPASRFSVPLALRTVSSTFRSCLVTTSITSR